MTRIKSPVVAAVTAVSALGANWDATWQALLSGQVRRRAYQEINRRSELEVPVADVAGLDRTIDESGKGPSARLALSVLSQIGSQAQKIKIFGGSNHAETDLLLHALSEDTPAASAQQWRGLLFDSVPAICGRDVHWSYGACASGLHALWNAKEYVEDTGLDALVMGVDALSAIGVAGFKCIGAISSTGSRPFDIARDGLLIGEGAAALRLSSAMIAKADSIRVLGIGMSCDAGHPTDPDPSGHWVGVAIDQALNQAGIRAAQVAAVISHGTGTPKNDDAEMKAISARWPMRATPITSVKRGLGHTMGAAGLFNVLVAVEACRTGRVPPTSVDSCTPLDEIDLVHGSARTIKRGGPIISVASGFGGNNVVCVVGSVP